MPRPGLTALLPATVLAMLLVACSGPRPMPVAAPVTEPPPVSTTEQWLALQRDVQEMEPEEAVERLVEVDRPEGIGQYYYYGLLNQQLETYGAWTQARDAFQSLESNPELAEGQRQLVALLREYNQTRINWYLRHRDLQSENAELRAALEQTVGEKAELEQKIRALTDLEAVISTRKEE